VGEHKVVSMTVRWQSFILLLWLALLAVPVSAYAAQESAPGEDSAGPAPGYAIVNTAWLNLRDGDSVAYAVRATLPGGTELDVLGRNHDFSWLFVAVRPSGQQGWVSGRYLILRGDASQRPIIEARGEPATPSLVIAWSGNALYDQAAISANALCNLPAGEYPLLGTSANGEWVVISAACPGLGQVRGWLRAEVGLIRNPAGRPLPVVRW
jgi:uncharacterized protein YraI